ncbi:Flp family type IVb pilin [Aurantiacibacter sp. MUD61]|uniref:Flp family type IVb pilin n=1 Tax=Aurantiacibacter sp. MUD61 TaxID=3009083 RepID=UPI0022F0E358|nr:Flp family type IVb pilin [Aurantiacibacter sp. MUD61]
MKTFLKTFLADESGASAAEYALIIAVVGVGIGAAALVLGDNVEQAVGDAANDVADCNSTTAGTPYSEDAGGTEYTSATTC